MKYERNRGKKETKDSARISENRCDVYGKWKSMLSRKEILLTIIRHFMSSEAPVSIIKPKQ